MWKKTIAATLFLCVLGLNALSFCACSQKKPVLYAPDVRVTLGTQYDVDDGVYALDSVDGDISDNIELVSGTLDTAKAGRYRLKYRVTNSRGARVSASRVIVVTSQSPSFIRTWLSLAAPVLAAVFACMAAGFFFSSRKYARRDAAYRER